MKSTEKLTFWVRFCVSALAVFENVFDITVFVKSMTKHFQNNLYMLYMTIPDVKKMLYTLYTKIEINLSSCALRWFGD